MKKMILMLVFMFSFIVYNGAYAAGGGPPPPPGGGGSGGGGGHGQGNNQGAPIGGGLEILIALGAMYAGKKVYHLRKEKEEDKE